MNCPHCTSTTTKKQTQKTTLGSCTFRCSACKHLFNERSGTPFNFLEYPTDVVLLVVLWRLRYKLSLRDLAEMFLERGLVFSQETVREWEARFTPFIAEKLRARRHGHAGTSWHIDETYIKVPGKWCYLCRAVDHDGNLVDSMLSEKRNMEAAQRFFKQAVAVVGHTPEPVTTDGHRSYPRAIRETMGKHVQHRTNTYLNNRLEQEYRGIKQRYYPMRGFETREPMSLKPEELGPIPEETARVARAAYPKGNVCMHMRDEWIQPVAWIEWINDLGVPIRYMAQDIR